MQRYRIAFQYVGTKYNGFAKQLHLQTTVQEILSNACKQFIKIPSAVTAEENKSSKVEEPATKRRKIDEQSKIEKEEATSNSEYIEEEEEEEQITPDDKKKVSTPGELIGSSRTDTGVHALYTTGHVDLIRYDRKSGTIATEPFEPMAIMDGLNHRLLEEDIRVLEVHSVPQDFHARFNAVERTYLYRIIASKPIQSSPFLKDRVWYLTHPTFKKKCRNPKAKFEDVINIERMREAAKKLEGRHDFSAFRITPSEGNYTNPVRTINSIRIEVKNLMAKESDPIHSKDNLDSLCFSPLKSNQTNLNKKVEEQFVYEIQIYFSSKSFLHHQVRIMTGMLLRIGLGDLEPKHVEEAFEKKDRSVTDFMAPSSGLYLANVKDDYNF